ncbi:MAG: hypothetical protein ING00_16090 [Roseomonas sp.]|nr:hypothetical protein [Roseomonas sp.]
MPTLGDVVSSLLPNGSRGKADAPTWEHCPIWPPDVFAVAATLVDRSGCYAEPSLAISRDKGEREEKRARAVANRKLGQQWYKQLDSILPDAVSSEWRVLWNHRSNEICVNAGEGTAWKRAALNLLAIADEACMGAGYFPDDEEAFLPILVARAYLRIENGGSAFNLPESLCLRVPREVACVLPKSLTPEVGCNLRSLSHHLALLPGCGSVRPQWNLSAPPVVSGGQASHPEHSPDHGLNLLLIPFPYVVEGKDFIVTRPPEEHENGDRIDGYFSLTQKWLENIDGTKIRNEEFNEFIANLIREAQKEVSAIHGIVFPETSLTHDYLIDLARYLETRFPQLEMLVGGVLRKTDASTRNEAVIIRLEKGSIKSFVQSKHHRWRLEDSQLSRYNIGHRLDPRHAWWEQIDVHDRTIIFSLSRHQAVMSALVCEDLARFDPVIPVLNAVGPNLIFALLMDGPQTKDRWSGRYATVLAEDPGSAVLTLTCLGMVRRSYRPGQTEKHVVGLWKSRGDDALELTLPTGAHALVLALGVQESNQRTLDLRQGKASGVAVEYRLAGLKSVRIADPPGWLERAELDPRSIQRRKRKI